MPLYLMIMLAEALRVDRVAVNVICPGWVRTEIGSPNATLSMEEGAEHCRLAGRRSAP